MLLAGCAAMLVLPVTLSGGPVADAHPLGNFTVNHYDGLSLFPDRIELRADGGASLACSTLALPYELPHS